MIETTTNPGRLLLALGACILLSGCGQGGPKTYSVEGTVTYQGEPLPLGTVMFVPESGPPSKPAAIDANGHYRLETVAGKHRVQVVAMPERKGGRPDMNVEGGVDYTDVEEVESLIPAKYGRFDTSGVTVTVEAAKTNTIPIDLP
jgi:hypothetical protein